MAAVKDIKINNYCDAVNNELLGMKKNIHRLQDDAKKAYGEGSEQYRTYERHLCELSDMIEWKLQLLMKSCPFDWHGQDKDFDSTVSVGPAGKAPETDFSGGYLGG